MRNTVRALLSPAAREIFDDVSLQRVLGASAHIRLIGDMLLSIADQPLDGPAMKANAAALAVYFTQTRGASSQAISNAIALMMAQVAEGSAEEVARSLRASVEAYRSAAAREQALIREYLWSVLEGKQTLLLYDYSSTVAAIAGLGREHGVQFTVFLPESRALDGGRPYVKPFLEAGHTVRFIPDCALYHYLPQCEAAFIGSETYYPDGTCFNTVGSELVAFLCSQFHVPFYVPTPLLKVDMRALQGYRKPPIINDHRQKLGGQWPEAQARAVDFLCPELVSIAPRYITAYITEEGILPPWAMYPASRDYARRLKEGGAL